MAASASASHAWASIRWFGGETRTMRVRIERREGGNVWVRTADIADAGTALVLDEAAILEAAQ